MTATPASDAYGFERRTLSNGLRLVHVPIPGLHSVSVTVYVGVGSRDERDHEQGVAHLIEHMLFKGTRSRPTATDLSRAIDGVGGMLNASTDKELTTYWAKVAGEHLPLAVDVVSDMLLHSRLSPADLGREKEVVSEELRMVADDPQDRVHVLAEEVLWPHQAIGREIAGTPESVEGLARKTLRGFMSTYYGANNALVATAGGAPIEKVVGLLEEAFSTWAYVDGRAPAAARPASPACTSIETKPTEQVHLCVAYPGLPRNHPDRYALDLLCTILGGGTSSRLFATLRDRLALAYDVHAYTTYLADAGSFVVYAGVDSGKVDRALNGIAHEIERLQRRRVADDELARTKQFLRGRLWLGLEEPHAVANWFGSQQILQHEVVTPQQVVEFTEAVTPDDVRRLAREIMRPDMAHVVAVGPVSDVRMPGMAA